MELAGQILGITGAILSIIGFQIKKNKPYYIVQTIIGLCFALSFVCLQSIVSALLNITNILRGAILAGGKKFRHNAYLIGLNVLYIGFGLLGIFLFPPREGVNPVIFYIATSLSVLANIAGTLSYWTRSGKNIRLVQLSIVSPCWLFNNIVVSSWGGVITEIVNMGSVIVSLIRYGINGFETAQTEDSAEQTTVSAEQ